MQSESFQGHATICLERFKLQAFHLNLRGVQARLEMEKEQHGFASECQEMPPDITCTRIGMRADLE